MNPAALKTNIGDLPPGGALIVNSDAFTQQNLNKAAYAQQPADRRLAQGRTPSSRSRSRRSTSARSTGLDMTTKQKDLTKNFFALGHHVLAVRAEHGPDARAGSTRSSAARPVIAEANKRALKAGYAFGETTEMFHTHYRVAAGQAAARARTGTSPATRRPRSASWPRRKLADRPLFYGSLPDHARPATSSTSCRATRRSASRRSRPRTRSRRSARRSARRYGGALGLTASSGPGIALKTRGDGPRGDGRAAARRHRRPARRPVDRACRPRTSRRTCSRSCSGATRDSPIPIVAPATPGECFDLRDRGVPARAQVHDPGRLPVRRVPRHRLRAVADPDRSPTCPTSRVDERDRPRRPFQPVPARPRDARPAVGRPGHARPRAPHRRPREGRHHRQRQLRPGQPPPDAAAARRPRSPASPTTSRRSRSSGRSRATC